MGKVAYVEGNCDAGFAIERYRDGEPHESILMFTMGRGVSRRQMLSSFYKWVNNLNNEGYQIIFSEPL